MDKDGKEISHTDLYTSVPVMRKINGLPVMGQGSTISVDVGLDGSIVGLDYHWVKLDKGRGKVVLKKRMALTRDILRDASKKVGATASTRIEAVIPVYYDDGMGVIEPGFHYWGSTEALGGSPLTGFVSALDDGRACFPDDSIPSIGPLSDPIPEAEAVPEQMARAFYVKPTVGRFVVRQDYQDWVNSANSFMDGLGTANFSYGDYIWDYPNYWFNDSWVVNRWDIVSVAGHGSPWYFTTLGNSGEPVNLANSDIPGYGKYAQYAAGNQGMHYLNIFSCSVIPSNIEKPTEWANPWWRIFKGLRAVTGYRTVMLIIPDIMKQYGKKLNAEQTYIQSWFSAVNSNGTVKWYRFWGLEGTSYPSAISSLGYDSAVTDCNPVTPENQAGLLWIWK